MESVIKLMNSERKEIGRLIVTEGHSVKIDIITEFAFMEEDIKKLGKSINEQKNLPLRESRKDDNCVMIMQERVGKEDERYVKAVVEFINNSRMIVPRIFAVHVNNEGRD